VVPYTNGLANDYIKLVSAERTLILFSTLRGEMVMCLGISLNGVLTGQLGFY